MTKDNCSIADLFEAIKNKLGQDTGETPVKCITPGEFTNMCAAHGIDHQTAYDLATFAVSLVRGMLNDHAEISTIVGGCKGGTLGGELIVQVESLKNVR